jgi:competence protein ComEA
MPGSPIEPDDRRVEPTVVPIEVEAARPAYGESFAERWAVWRREPRLITAALAVIALAAGAWWVRLSVSAPSATGAKSGAHSDTNTGSTSAADARPPSPTTTSAVLVVDVVGAVRRAGVVSLPGTARVVDALTAAGGALPNADLERINLAAHLVDGMRIEVPRRGFPTDAAGPTGNSGGGTGGAATGAAPSPSAPLDLNSATQAQLEALPGIGPSLAQAIIQERDREGGFHSVDDLRRVRGIGDVRFAQLRPLVTV